MKELITELENEIRANRIVSVREKINALSFAEIPRVHAAKLANLALRSGALFWAVRLLNPIVRSDSLGIKASVEEKAEYAFALNRIGAHAEAKRILVELENQNLPKIQLYLAAIHANAWDYESARVCFEKYLSFTELTSYERQIGRLNLISCMISSDYQLKRAGEELTTLRSELENAPNQLLYGNTIELTVQLHLKAGEFDECAKWIEKGRQVFPEVDSVFSLFFKKWESILKIRRGDGDARLLMMEVKDQATRLQHHETIREADFHLAIASADDELFNKVYFGTPWPLYRERLLTLKPKSVRLREFYSHCPSFENENEASTATLEISPLGAKAYALGSSDSVNLKSGQLLHRLLYCLLSDFYRPMWVAAVFTHLFSDEFFHPEAGPKRVHQAIFRLRKWLSDAGIPLEIQEVHGRYQLTWLKPCRVELGLENIEGPAKGAEAVCRKLVQIFDATDFGTQDASKALKISPTLARQALKWGVDNSRLTKVGSGPRTRYKKAS